MKNQNGFTLIEAMITIVVLSIIATIAYTSYQSHVLRARRTDAIQTLLSMQLAQEQYRANNTTYGTLSNIWGGTTTTTNGQYNLSISNTAGSSYTLTASASGTQASDSENGTSCATLSIAMINGTETKSPAACWIK